MIAITAAATFALLDMYAPSIGSAARQGTGFGIGANLSGFPNLFNLLIFLVHWLRTYYAYSSFGILLN